MGNVSGFGLEEKQQVAVFLSLFVVGEEAFLEFDAVRKVICDFILLHTQSVSDTRVYAYVYMCLGVGTEGLEGETHLFQCHAVLNEQGYPRVEISHILFENKVLLGL